MFVRVHVTADSNKDMIDTCTQEKSLVFKAQVKEKAQQHMANRRVHQLVAHHFEKPIRDIRLVTGHRSPVKVFFVEEG